MSDDDWTIMENKKVEKKPISLETRAWLKRLSSCEVVLWRMKLDSDDQQLLKSALERDQRAEDGILHAREDHN